MLALDEACFACAGVGVVFKDLSESVLDVCCKVGCVAHSALSVPYSGGVLKLMPMTMLRNLGYFGAWLLVGWLRFRKQTIG